jgi:hypothetical protein
LSTFLDFIPHQLVTESTRIAGNTANILDLFLVDNTDMSSDITSVDVIPGVSDHLAVLAILISFFNTNIKLPKRQVLNFKRANWAGLKQQLSDRLPVNFNNTDINEACKLCT